MLKRKLLSVLLASTILITACNVSRLNRTINVLNVIPSLIVALHRPNEAELLQVVSEITRGVVVFRDNPTRANLDNALAIFDSVLSRNVFNFNPSLLAIIVAARALLGSVLPVGVTMASNERVIVNINEEDVKELERRVKALKAEVRR